MLFSGDLFGAVNHLLQPCSAFSRGPIPRTFMEVRSQHPGSVHRSGLYPCSPIQAASPFSPSMPGDARGGCLCSGAETLPVTETIRHQGAQLNCEARRICRVILKQTMCFQSIPTCSQLLPGEEKKRHRRDYFQLNSECNKPEETTW